MNRSKLYIWCDRLWLYPVYLLGIIMLNILILRLEVMNAPEKMMCILAILLPAHVFEENSWPGGFFYMNNIGFKSDNPCAYPQSMLTNMFTNLGAEIMFIIYAFVLCAKVPAAVVTFIVLFGIAETFNHTREGISMLNRYREKGKRTIYAPGFATCWLGLLELSVYALVWLFSYGANGMEILTGIGLLFFTIVPFIMIPLLISGHVKSTSFEFKDIGYFKKYER